MVQLILTSISVHKIMSAGQPCTLLLLDVQKYVTQLKLSKLPSLCSCRLLGIVNLDSCTIQNKTCTPRRRWILPCEGPESGSQKFQTPATFEEAEVTNTRTRQRRTSETVEAISKTSQPAISQPYICATNRAAFSFSYTCLLTNTLPSEHKSSIFSSSNNKPRMADGCLSRSCKNVFGIPPTVDPWFDLVFVVSRALHLDA
jgi:hypothetical protein